ncbi:hypothetical protein NE452_16940, partial [Paeniclostridium sordellii]|nr:hypothetical protein [Paeniclostridium sordellii]
KKLVKLLGGNSLYIPKEVSLTRPIRDRIIKEDFNGVLVREEQFIRIIGFCGCLIRHCREATIRWIMAERL